MHTYIVAKRDFEGDVTELTETRSGAYFKGGRISRRSEISKKYTVKV